VVHRLAWRQRTHRGQHPNTERYFVTIEIPLYLSFWKMVGSGVTNKSYYECFKWDEAATNKFHVFDRQTGTLTTIDSGLKFFYFHTVNAYEEEVSLIHGSCA
jgi:carotenoid cleavage dioxygenase-like enzyme